MAQQQQQLLAMTVSSNNRDGMSTLACSPWIRTVCRHLHKLNPKFEKLVSLLANNASFMQDTIQFTMSNNSKTK